MKSIKPGRGPSGMKLIGALGAVIFGLFWTGTAVMISSGSGMGGIGFIFPMFGIIFVIFGIAQAAYHYKNTMGKERFSLMDIVDKKEEGDPADRWIKNEIASKDGIVLDNMDSGQLTSVHIAELNWTPHICTVRNAASLLINR